MINHQRLCIHLYKKVGDKLFKYSHGKERYTETLPKHLKTIFQFIIGTYKLLINNRKNFNISRIKTLCKICDKAVVRDKIIFI